MLGNEEDAMDAAQEVFVRLIREAKRLSNLYPSSFLYTVATNVCLNVLRGKRRHGETTHNAGDLPLLSFDRGYEKVEAEMILDAILRVESESTRAICFMYHADGMTLKEIGASLGLSVAGVWKRLKTFNARARSRHDFSGLLMKEKNDDE
jgi:RNA polymerase sigma-70 factor (ECF subfamily)